MISSFKEIPIPFDKVFVGEVGLTGEVRSIPGMSSRIGESAKFGMRYFCAPIKSEESDNIKLIDIKSIEDLVRYLTNLNNNSK